MIARKFNMAEYSRVLNIYGQSCTILKQLGAAVSVKVGTVFCASGRFVQNTVYRVPQSDKN